MKVYIILDKDCRLIQRIYTKEQDFEKFARLYADDHSIVEVIDTIKHKLPRIDEETVQRWAIQFDKENGAITDIIRGVSVKQERIDDLLKKCTTTIFVDALTRSEAIEKAQKIYNNGKD